MRTAIRGIADAFGRAMRALTMRPVADDGCSYGAASLTLQALIAIGTLVIAEYAQTVSGSYFYNYGLAAKVTAWSLFLLLSALIGGATSRHRLPHLLMVSLAIFSIINLGLAATTAAWSELVPPHGPQLPWAAIFFVLWETVGLFRLARFTYGDVVRFPGCKFVIASLLSAAILPAAPVLGGTLDPRSFADVWNVVAVYQYYAGVPAGDTSDGGNYPTVNVERTYYKQRDMISALLSNVEKSSPERPPQTYFLGMAPDDTHSVFEREVLSVRDIADDRAGTKNRSLLLINSESTLEGFPLANVSNLGLALDGISKRMDKDRDTLLLYISSHGAEDYLAVNLKGFSFNPMSATTLADILDRSEIRKLVVVISACHSGSFIDELEGPDRIVIAAAREDRTSFGCSNDRDWTYFGDAYFNHGLRQTSSFTEAFEIARDLIEKWENEQGLTPSQPQISIGSSVAGPTVTINTK